MLKKVLTVLALVAPAVVATSAEAKPDKVSVDRVTFPVTLSDGNTYNVAGFYYHHNNANNQTLQLVVHGLTYDHKYWDADVINGQNYSYADYMVNEGYSVLAIDQLGAGVSDQPFGYFLNLNETASSLHQVIDSLRQKRNPTGRKFEQIVLVGHSNGSLTAIREESLYHSADALITTAWGHTPGPVFDPSFIFPYLANPYFPPTAFPLEVRATVFYYLPKADPAVVSYDASTLASTVSTGQALDLFGILGTPDLDGAANVAGPVLVQLADKDTYLAPAMGESVEAAHWPNARVTVQQLTDIGHDYNLHVNRVQSWRGIDTWIQRLNGHGGGCN